MNSFRVLRLTVAKRPVLFADFNQINEHVLPAQAETLVQSVRALLNLRPGSEDDLASFCLGHPGLDRQ